jgi:uncharacterized membrane protein YkvA (DUF1232 family)
MKEYIFETIEEDKEKIEEKDAESLIGNEKSFSKKITYLDRKKFTKFYRQLKLAYRMIKDYVNKEYKDVPWRTIGLLTLAVLYFLNPFDLIPDLIPVIGFADDAALMAAVFKSVQVDLVDYCEFRGLNVGYYFNKK